MEASRGSPVVEAVAAAFAMAFACALNKKDTRTELLVDSMKHDSRSRGVGDEDAAGIVFEGPELALLPIPVLVLAFWELEEPSFPEAAAAATVTVWLLFLLFR